MRTFLRQIRPAVLLLAVFTVLCGVVYPLGITGIGQLAFHSKANGSLVKSNGTVVGSSLIGQPFQGAQYFHSRPSAAGAGAGYDGSASSGSNLGPSNPDLLTAVAERTAAYRQENSLTEQVLVPVDAVTASASGLDPDITVANARLQVGRVATARGLDEAAVLSAVDRATTRRSLGFLGDDGVNVLELNLLLDSLSVGDSTTR
jgi:potassium-transporting ATPase KdpC subunit